MLGSLWSALHVSMHAPASWDAYAATQSHSFLGPKRDQPTSGTRSTLAVQSSFAKSRAGGTKQVLSVRGILQNTVVQGT